LDQLISILVCTNPSFIAGLLGNNIAIVYLSGYATRSIPYFIAIPLMAFDGIADSRKRDVAVIWPDSRSFVKGMEVVIRSRFFGRS